MSSPWIFICPSSRGIGRSLTRHLLRTTALPILATTRQDLASAKASLLDDLHGNGNEKHEQKQKDASSRLHLVNVDVTDPSSVEAASQRARELFPPRDNHLHLSFAIPGVLTPEKSPAQVDYDASVAMFRVNTLGPLLLMKHFADMLPRQATEIDETKLGDLNRRAVWAFMSARVGSVTENKAGGWFSYRASKAAVNSIAKSLDIVLEAKSGDKALAMAYHPGTVKTELSRKFWGSVPEEKLFSPEYAAERMVKVVSEVEGSHRGKCLDWKGEVIPP